MLVDLVYVVVRTDVAAVGIAIDRRKVVCALALPVCSGDETGDDGRLAARSTILPVREWFVAKHPVPLPVAVYNRNVVDVRLAEYVVVDVVGVEASEVPLVFIAVILTGSWDDGGVDPVGVVRQGCC